ncbi:hypothetical protein KYY02_19400 [Streptomyces pimonensis]|uniref:Secreted protein n=1 Tax=Streptomyces pimonensis TaxID=2860288 RepID=A0ABV4J3I4_9ACTN
MLRYIAWALAALYLLTVGLWPAAITPVTLTLAGLAAVIATIPPSVLLLAAAVVWLKRKPALAKPVTA